MTVRDIQRRWKAVRAARQSSVLDGAHSTDVTRADQVLYACGSITAEQMGDRVRLRYGLR
jgi:Antitoxin VbhA